jgi:starch synthase (maltosyl-transferring)
MENDSQPMTTAGKFGREEDAMPDGIKRVIIENVQPSIDDGRFPIRRAVGETVQVRADIFSDGHDQVAAELVYRKAGADEWRRRPLVSRGNDRWDGVFRVSETGIYEYSVHAWIDRFRSWLNAVVKKAAGGLDVRLEMTEGARIVEAAADRAENENRLWLARKARFLAAPERTLDKLQLARDPDLARMMDAYPDKGGMAAYDRVLSVTVEPLRGRFSAWYELFPRSCGKEPGCHGTLQDCMARLPQIADMGFDVLYLPPVHPIGHTHRKGKNNAAEAGASDPGSPWAIGAETGGHRSIHPALGTLEDFRQLVAAARAHEIEVAMDLAFQCSPDHPYVAEHPEWFRRRPDGSIQYAENPPKKYEDIYPFDFESKAADALREELLDVVRFWIGCGVRIFRVDNPHTKPITFWQWLIGEVKKRDPEVIFLAEAFTRPKTLYRLAKGGFTQSYTYFTWRNLKSEIETYLTELTRSEAAEFFWPNFWPNTPDILPEYLQVGGRPAFIARLVLAGTLSSNYGIYGPAFELCENEPRVPFSEEYLNSEKYEIHAWDLERAGHIRGVVKRINRIRRGNAALHQTRNLRFLPVDREEILCYVKYTDEMDNIILTAVNLDPHHTHAGWLRLPVEALGLPADQPFQMHDLISDARYLWHGERNYIELDPRVMPAHVFRIRKRMRSEHDFDYFM